LGDDDDDDDVVVAVAAMNSCCGTAIAAVFKRDGWLVLFDCVCLVAWLVSTESVR